MRSYRFAAMAALASITTTALLLLTATSTYAADLGKPKLAAPSPDEEGGQYLSYKGGAYLGILGGYSAAVFEAENVDLGAQDPMVGAYLGYTYVQNGWAIGLEGDFLLTAIETAAGDGEFAFKATNDYLASLRLRTGVTWGPILAYVTGGVAYTEQKITIEGDSTSEELWGLAGGLGVEAEVTRTITLRLEGLHYSFDDEVFSFGEGDSIEASNDQTVIRAGLSLKLN